MIYLSINNYTCMGQLNSCGNCMVIISVHYFQNDQAQQVEDLQADWRLFLETECGELPQCSWATTLRGEINEFKSKPPPEIMQDFKQIMYHIEYSQNRSLLFQNSIGSESKLEGNNNLVDSYVNSFHESESFSTASFAFHDELTIKKLIQLEPQKQRSYRKQFQQYVQIMSFLKENIKRTELQTLIAIFASRFTYRECQLADCLFDIQQFSRIFCGCVLRYFSIKNLPEHVISEEHVLCFSVSMICEEVYPILYQQIHMHLQEKVKETSALMVKFSDCDGAFFGVPERFLLEGDSQSKSMVSAPYAMSIQSLKKIRNKRSPASKLKVVIKTAQRILKSIRLYHQDQNEKLDSEDLLPILTYILVKSELYDIDVHAFLIQKLATNSLLYNASGYYLVSLQAASESLRYIKC